MFDIIKRVFLFLLPILKMASLQAAADTINEIIDPRPSARRRRQSGYTSYNRMADYAKRDVARTRELFDEPARNTHEGNDYHDVLMVAFDISGANAEQVHEFLRNTMPEAETRTADGVYLDSWWIADDEAPGDCDSAVFVKKGLQKRARALLRDMSYLS